MQPKILFFAEVVTSAHLFRPLWFASQLANEGYEVHLATTSLPPILSNYPNIVIHELKNGIRSEVFLNNIRKGKIPFTYEIIKNNFRQDEELINKIKPSFVVDDFRLSLSMVAERQALSHLTITNITWSPYFNSNLSVIPDIELVKNLGLLLGGILFKSFKPLYEHNILKPFNAFRKNIGLKSIDSLAHLYASGSKVGYLDLPEFAPQLQLPENHKFLGFNLFSYPNALPKWWSKLDRKKPWVYISLGSSGRNDLLESIVQSLKDLSCEILVSSSGKELKGGWTKNCHWARYVPDHQVLPHCQLYIGNGGSAGAQHALNAAVPILALPDNYDQWLYATLLKNLNLCEIYRPSLFSKKFFLQLVDKILNDKSVYGRIQKIKKSIQKQDPLLNFKNFMGLTQTSEKKAI
ncbi:MAG: hypothetical protein H6625_08550 [Bdellovibrionaceae bacterium]|nr:hypothetical protein [Pseudobdellovibrionaceae bacterium]